MRSKVFSAIGITAITGIIQAMQSSNLDPASIFSVGVDGNRAGYDQVKDGDQSLSLAQDFEVITKESLRLARIVLEGGNG